MDLSFTYDITIEKEELKCIWYYFSAHAKNYTVIKFSVWCATGPPHMCESLVYAVGFVIILFILRYFFPRDEIGSVS